MTDAGGVGSSTATATLNVTPVASDGAAAVSSGTTKTVDIPVPVATGPLTATIVSGVPADQGEVKIVPGAPGAVPRFEIRIDGTYSGITSLTYTVTDADGLTSAPATLDITVGRQPRMRRCLRSRRSGQAVVPAQVRICPSPTEPDRSNGRSADSPTRLWAR